MNVAGILSMTASGGLRASAVNATKFLTVQETRALYGDVITAQVYHNGSYHNVRFQYLAEHNTTPAGLNHIVPSGSTSFGIWPSVEYVCFDTGDVTTSQDAVTVYLQPQYSVFNTENFSTFVALSTEQDVPSAVYDSSAWDFSGTLGAQTFYSPISYENGAQNGMYSTAQMFSENYPHDNKVVAVPVDIQETRTFTISSVECRFRGCSPWWDYSNNRMYLYVGCPRIDDVAEYSSGTVTETTATSGGGGGGDVNVTVIVDNSGVIAEQSKMNSLLEGDEAETETTLERLTVTIDGSAVISDTVALVENAGFWVSLMGRFVRLAALFTKYVPVFLLLAVAAFMIWRK